LALVLLGLFALSGCSHRRTALRPVYGTPVPATLAPAPAPGTTILSDPEGSEPFLAPVTPMSPSKSLDSSASPASGSPPVAAPAPAEEPPLNEIRPIAPSTGSNSNSPALSKPSAYRQTSRTAVVSARSRKVSLRENVSPYLDNPDELFLPPKADRPWKYVVLHHSANARGGYDQIDRDHRKILGFEGCGYHFVIGNGTDSPDGQIEVAERWLNQKHGVHARNGKTPEVNEYGVGICLVGNFDQTKPTPRQIAAARALVAYLADRYGIDAQHVGTHSELADGPTACPGKNFPTDAILGSQPLAKR
jgi:hypothetical protein